MKIEKFASIYWDFYLSNNEGCGFKIYKGTWFSGKRIVKCEICDFDIDRGATGFFYKFEHSIMEAKREDTYYHNNCLPLKLLEEFNKMKMIYYLSI